MPRACCVADADDADAESLERERGTRADARLERRLSSARRPTVLRAEAPTRERAPAGASAAARWRRVGVGVRMVARMTTTTSERLHAALAERVALEAEGDLERAATSGKTTLDARLGRLGLRRIACEGDGNCQFRALAHNVFKTQARHGDVREAATRRVESRREDFEVYFEDSGAFERWLKEMKRDRTWGDELTLRAACDAFGVRIHVIQSTEKNWHLLYEPLELKSKRVAFLSYVSPVHYDAIAEK